MKVRRDCLGYLENRAGPASPELLVSEERTAGLGCPGLLAGREIPGPEVSRERRVSRVCRVPPASRDSPEPRAVKELRDLKVSREGKEAKEAAELKDCPECRELQDRQENPGCLAGKV